MAPLPQDLMAINSLQLKNDFIGYPRKLVILFLGFLNAMYRIGSNKILLFLLSYSYGVQIARGRVDKFKSVFKLSKPGGISIDFLDPNDSSRIPYLDREDSWNITTDT